MCGVEIGFGQDHDELLPSIAPCGVALPKRVSYQTTNCLERHVASEVSVLVIERFEAVRVNHRDAQSFPIALSAAELDSETIVHIAPAEKSGERIAGGELKEPLAARDQRETQHSGGSHNDEPCDLIRPAKDAIGERRVARIVQLPVT